MSSRSALCPEHWDSPGSWITGQTVAQMEYADGERKQACIQNLIQTKSKTINKSLGDRNPAFKIPPNISVLTLMTVPYSNDQLGVKIHIF